MATPEKSSSRTGWKPWYSLWCWLLLGWMTSAADRALTGPVVTWMIQNDVAFLRGVPNPYGLAGLIGGLFFAGYMLTQFPGGYLGDRFGHRTLLLVSMFWAGLATIASGLISGLVAFIALRVITGLGEGAYYSNDRGLITEATPHRQRSLGMGVVITGLALGLTLATVGTPFMIDFGRGVFGPAEAWRMPFLLLGALTSIVAFAQYLQFRRHGAPLPFGKAALSLARYSAVTFAAIMALYFVGRTLGLADIWVAVLEVALAGCMVLFALTRMGGELAPVVRNRDLFLVYLSSIAVLWNLWFFGFWAVAVVGAAAQGSSFLQAALVAGFNAGAGILGFPAGGWLSDRAVRGGLGRKPMLLAFTLLQGLLTVVFAYYQSTGTANLVAMAALLFFASLFFNALQPIQHALAADLADPQFRGAAFGMLNLIGEIGAVLSPAVSGLLRDVTGSWTVALYLDAAIVLASFCVLVLVRERLARPVLSPVLAEARAGARS